MSIEVDIQHRLGAFVLNVAFETSGKVTALFGPSGAGKSSLVNALGGLLRPQSGRIRFGDQLFVDTDKRIFTPMHRRRIGYVFQDARLFPHLTVAQNLAYGRWFTPTAQRYARTDQIVDMLGIGHLLQRKPSALSGGEAQRVAIGRALACSPRLLLMDEPLASLDDARKAEVLPFIERLRDEMNIPIVYVSHSITEVARLADDIVVLEDGRVATAGPAETVLMRPDLLPQEQRGDAGAVLDTRIVEQDTIYGMTLLRSAAGEIRVPLIDATPGQHIRLRIRARDVMLSLQQPVGISGLNVLPGTIVSVTTGDGPNAEVALDCGGQTVFARVTRLSSDRLKLDVGLPVYAIVKSVSFDGAAQPLAMRNRLEV